MKTILAALFLLTLGQAHAMCPDGATPDATLGFCVQGSNAFGPFTKAMTDACVAAGAGSSCTATVPVNVDGVPQNVQRWSKRFAQSLRGSASCPRGSLASSSHDGLCLESLGTSKSLYAVFSAPLAAKCRWLGNGSACMSNRWSASVYTSVRDAAPRITWTSPANLNSALPSGLQVFKGSGKLANGSTIQATLARFEPRINAQLEFDVESVSSGVLTPLAFGQRSGPRRWVIMNGGYFGGSPAKSSSLLVQAGAMTESGSTALLRNGRSYFPTRAAFGEDANGRYQAVWTYAGASALHQYPQPSPNGVGQAPQAEPSSSFPSGASLWSPKRAVGGGPMLLRAGAWVDTAAAELFDDASGVAPASAAPRSAIGKTASGALLMLVVDGRSALSGGSNLRELATLLQSLGAQEAINLDGGGSSSMVVNGALATSPSDASGLRPVHSVVVIRAR